MRDAPSPTRGSSRSGRLLPPVQARPSSSWSDASASAVGSRGFVIRLPSLRGPRCVESGHREPLWTHVAAPVAELGTLGVGQVKVRCARPSASITDPSFLGAPCSGVASRVHQGRASMTRREGGVSASRRRRIMRGDRWRGRGSDGRRTQPRRLARVFSRSGPRALEEPSSLVRGSDYVSSIGEHGNCVGGHP
jgi:hypothetical protein